MAGTYNIKADNGMSVDKADNCEKSNMTASTLKCFIQGGSALRYNPYILLQICHFWQKSFPFCVPFIEKKVTLSQNSVPPPYYE